MKQSSLENSKIANRYARSIFALMESGDEKRLVAQNLHILAAAFKENRDFMRLITSPLYEEERQFKLVEALKRLFGQKFNNKFENFLKLLVKNQRFGLLPQIASHYQNLIDAEQEYLKIKVAAAGQLSADQIEAIKKIFYAKLQKHIVVETTIDKSLIGGFVIKFGSYRIDTSILTKLKSLKTVLQRG